MYSSVLLSFLKFSSVWLKFSSELLSFAQYYSALLDFDQFVQFCSILLSFSQFRSIFSVLVSYSFVYLLMYAESQIALMSYDQFC